MIVVALRRDEVIGPEGFGYNDGSPEAAVQALLDGYLRETADSGRRWSQIQPEAYVLGRFILETTGETQVGAVRAALQRLHWMEGQGRVRWYAGGSGVYWQALDGLLRVLLDRRLPYGHDDLMVLLRLAGPGTSLFWTYGRWIVAILEQGAAAHGLGAQLWGVLQQQRVALGADEGGAGSLMVLQRIDALLGGGRHAGAGVGAGSVAS